MTMRRGELRFITLEDEDHQPLGVVAFSGVDWMVNCGQCSHAGPCTNPVAGVTELLAHIGHVHTLVPSPSVADLGEAEH